MLLDSVYREITNAIYLVPLQVERFRKREPDAVVLAAGATKARRLGKDREVRYEPGWITARRATLILTNDNIVCGSWKIPLTSMAKATLLRVRAFLAKALILKISTIGGDHYQFGLQYDLAWEKQTALKLAVEDSKIGYSAFSIVFRAVLLLVWLAICGFCGWAILTVMRSLVLGGH